MKVIGDYVDVICAIDETLTKKLAEQIIKSLFEQIKCDIESSEDVRINHFGTFKLKTRPARKGRNPQTGESINIDEKQVIAFKPSKVSK